jgi:hypothetical protein
MADVSAPTPIFLRGSAVLDYWLVHAEGLTVQPLGARVEEVVVAAPVGHAEALIVRSRMTRRRKAIPAASIVSVEPSAGTLLMDARTEAGPGRRAPRLSPAWIAAARVTAGRGQRFVRAHAAGALRSTRAGSVAALSWLRLRAVQAGTTTAKQSRLAGAHTASGVGWLRPRLAAALAWSRLRAVQVGKATAKHSRLAAAHTAKGVRWLTPRVVAGARTAVVTAARLTLTAAVIVARGVVRTARELERVTALAAERGMASLEARRARRGNEPKP